MTPEKLEAIRKRNKLKRLYNESKRRLDWDRYKTQRNLTSSLRRKAVSNYFRTTASNAEDNPKKFWQTVKPFMHSKKNISRDSIHPKEGGSLFVNKLEVAQIFSAHFSSFLKTTIVTGNTMITPVLPVIQVSRLYRDTALREKLFSFAL